MSQVFSSHKDTIILTMRMNILTFPQWQKISTGVGKASASHQGERIGQVEEDVYSSDYTACTGTANNKEQMCTEKSVHEMNV
jgi:hypothetical protein